MSEMISRNAALDIAYKHSYSNNFYVSKNGADIADAIRALPAVQPDVAAIRDDAREAIAALIKREQGQLLSDYDVHPEVWNNDPEVAQAAWGLTDAILALIDNPRKEVVPDASEICTPSIITYDDEGNPSYTFNEDHSWRDVARWIAKNPADLEEMIYILVEMELENNRLLKGKRVGYTVEFIGCFDE
jgi:hypothetical protein